MDEPQIVSIAIEKISESSKRRFIFMIVLSILISLVLVLISMIIYSSSGAAQLDLSRPGYVSVRSQAITGSNDLKDYSSTGPVDKSSIDEFKLLFDQQSKKIDAVDAFGSDPLSPKSLNIEN